MKVLVGGQSPIECVIGRASPVMGAADVQARARTLGLVVGSVATIKDVGTMSEDVQLAPVCVHGRLLWFTLPALVPV